VGTKGRKSRMNGGRPLGIKLIAAYLLMRAAALIAAMSIVYMRPELRKGADDFILYFAINLGSMLRHESAIISALLDVALGLGIWFLMRWSRTVIVMLSSYGLCRAAIGSAILMEIDRKFLLSQISSPYFAISVVVCVLTLFYLLDPDVKRLFGERE
jgi:hypothetical protein